MATISEKTRVDGGRAWQVTIRRKGHPLSCKTFRTKADAVAWANLEEADRVRGVFVSRKEAENTTLSEALDRYQKEITPDKKGARQELARVRAWQKTDLSKRYLATIQSKDIAKYRDERAVSVSSNTIRLELALLSHVFTIAVKEWGMTSLVNPVHNTRLPKPPGGRERRLLPGELERITSASSSGSPVLSSIVRFALETAMRRGEIANMEWTHIDMKKRVLKIPVAKVEPRKIPLSVEAVRILSEIPRRMDGTVWGLKPDSITQAFNRAVSRARDSYKKECEEKGENPDPSYLVDLTFHDLRHEATSRLFELGLSTEKVKEITGHKTYEMLARYTHLKPENIVLELDRLHNSIPVRSSGT